MISEQRPPVYNGHYFWVPRVVVVPRFDCNDKKVKIVRTKEVFFFKFQPETETAKERRNIRFRHESLQTGHCRRRSLRKDKVCCHVRFQVVSFALNFESGFSKLKIHFTFQSILKNRSEVWSFCTFLARLKLSQWLKQFKTGLTPLRSMFFIATFILLGFFWN